MFVENTAPDSPHFVGLEPSKLSDLALASEYRTGSSDPIRYFYQPCLGVASSYKRAVGYFRSSIYLMVGPSVLAFVKRGGTISLICSPELTEEDQLAIASGYATREQQASRQVELEIDELMADPEVEWKLRILATLVAVGRMEIKLAIRPLAHGLYHEKIGVFSDSSSEIVSFIGSANESWSGWHAQGNFESIEVFCSWRHKGEKDRATRHLQNFDSLWAGLTPEVTTVPFPEAARRKLIARAAASIQDLERESQTSSALQVMDKRKPLPHQSAAIAKWIAQGRRGIFEHATGSGKTFTALEAARPHIESGLPVLILLPSDLLLKQWAIESKQEFPQAAVILAGGGNDRWKEPGRLRRLSSPSRIDGGRILLSTMQTAATEGFRRSLWQGDHLLVIADEVHQIGSRFNSQCLLIESGSRLGLSATPQRYGDPEGTASIVEYFGPVVPPPITLQDAVAAGRLVDYLYYPHAIRLNAEEAEEWKSLTKAVRFEMALSSKTDGAKLSERAKMLLIRRSRVAKKAAAKAPLAANILKRDFEEGQGWLIYCEDSNHLAATMAEIISAGFNPIEYHSSMTGDRAATLSWFRRFGGILVSIKCLDEGVDIPSVSHAIILASSQNPRQFIQRRGRVLRKAGPEKMHAIIHDAIVVPIGLEEEPEQGSLLKAEFLRAIEFAASALNSSAGVSLREIAREVGFDPDEMIKDGIEEDAEE